MSAKNGQGSMTVTPTVVNAGSTNNFQFAFRGPKGSYNPGSQATVLVPAGWSAPQTNNASANGYINVVTVLGGSTASLGPISGSGPWTISINFSTSQKSGGFNLNYLAAVAPTNAGVNSFTGQTMQSGGALFSIRSGSPTVTVNSTAKTNTTSAVVSSLNPSVYGNAVTFSATVTSAGSGVPSGTITFLSGSVVLCTTNLNGTGQASFTTNRFSVSDSPLWITVQYGGNSNFNSSVSPVLQQTVNPVTLTCSGLAASDKVYDSTTTATLVTNSVVLAGVLAGDDVWLDASGTTTAFSDPNAGSAKTVNVTGLALGGNDSGNYQLSSTNATLAANIFQAYLTVTANDTNRIFGAANPPFSANYTGFVGGDTASVLSGSPAFSCPAVPSSPIAGNPYPINVTTGTLAAANYSFVFVSGSLTITPGAGQPQRIFSIVKLGDGSLQLGCGGASGHSYLIEACTNPGNESWTVIATNAADVNGYFTNSDSTAPNYPVRFYRTKLP